MARLEQLEPVEEPLDLRGTAERAAPEFATEQDVLGPLVCVGDLTAIARIVEVTDREVGTGIQRVEVAG